MFNYRSVAILFLVSFNIGEIVHNVLLVEHRLS